jgi:hypothetical protein
VTGVTVLKPAVKLTPVKLAFSHAAPQPKKVVVKEGSAPWRAAGKRKASETGVAKKGA